MKAPRVELHIEELVLHGFERGDRHAIADAVERELSRLLAEQFSAESIPPAFSGDEGITGSGAHLDAGAFQLASNARPDAVGVQIAQTVYGGLTR